MNKLNNIEEDFFEIGYKNLLLGKTMKAKAIFNNNSLEFDDKSYRISNKEDKYRNHTSKVNRNKLLNLKISAEAPLDVDANYGANLIKSLFENTTNLNIRTFMQDDRKEITDKEIENAISKLIW